jgi:hypothetical protein
MTKHAMSERYQRRKVNSYLGESALGENTIELISMELEIGIEPIVMMTVQIAKEEVEVKQGVMRLSR